MSAVAVTPANPVADSLRASAAIFATSGRAFEAEFTRSMIEGAEAMPAFYFHWAHQQAERALRYRPQLEPVR